MYINLSKFSRMIRLGKIKLIIHVTNILKCRVVIRKMKPQLRLINIFNKNKILLFFEVTKCFLLALDIFHGNTCALCLAFQINSINFL